MVAWWLTRAVDRWRDAAARDAVVDAGLAAQRFPQRIALAWSAEWLFLFTAVTLIGGSPNLLVLSGVLLRRNGQRPAAARAQPGHLAGRSYHAQPVAGGAGGRRAIPAPPLNLRGRLAFYSLCLCLAPAFYITAIVFAARAPTD